MLIQIIKKIIGIRLIANKLIVISLKFHNFLYQFSSILAIELNNGVHPKHRIIRYKEWFLSEIFKDDVVLDIGCNTGTLANVVSDKALFVYGIDINSEHIEQAKKKFNKNNNVEFICADATTIDYLNYITTTVDVILLSNVLEHIEDRIDFLNKILNQVNWSGEPRLLIRVPMIDRDWLTIYKKELNIEYRLDRTHYTEYSYSSLKNELNNACIYISHYKIQWGEIYAVCKGRK
jgi:SAM-dependent methyltransferase